MVQLLVGENSFEIEQTLKRLGAEFDGAIEKRDGAGLELYQLADLLTGTSLFSQKRLVIIRDLSDNKTVWEKLPDWLDRVSDDVQLVLAETKLDKRTKTYKSLQKTVNIIEHKPWTDRDQGQAERWATEQAKALGIDVPPSLMCVLVARVGVDQWQLSQALDKLRVLDTVTEEVLRDVIEAHPTESVFELFETALQGDTVRLRDILSALQRTEDPYMLFGLLSGQAFQLAALAVAREGDDVARDFGVHPYALSRLRPYAATRGSLGAQSIIATFARADDAMKSSVDPWIAIDQALFALAE